MRIFNKTHADCTWAMEGSEFYNQPVECCIDETCEHRGKQLLSYLILLIAGICIYLLALLLRLCKANKETEKEEAFIQDLVHVLVLFVFLQPSALTRIVQEIGVTFIILGCTMKFYEKSFFIVPCIVLMPSICTLLVKFLFIYFKKKEGSTYTKLNQELTKMIIGDKKKFQESVIAVDIYQDFNTPNPRLIVTFVAQAALVVIYFMSLLTELKPDFTDIDTFLYYGLGALVQIVYNNTNEKFGYDDFWFGCYLNFTAYQHGADNTEQSLRTNLICRCFFSILINVFCRDLITLLLPLHLAHSDEYMDFVLNAVAAYFIIDLDDLDGASIKIEKWKEQFDKLQKSLEGTSGSSMSTWACCRHARSNSMNPVNTNDDNGDEEQPPPQNNEEPSSGRTIYSKSI